MGNLQITLQKFFEVSDFDLRFFWHRKGQSFVMTNNPSPLPAILLVFPNIQIDALFYGVMSLCFDMLRV